LSQKNRQEVTAHVTSVLDFPVDHVADWPDYWNSIFRDQLQKVRDLTDAISPYGQIKEVYVDSASTKLCIFFPMDHGPWRLSVKNINILMQLFKDHGISNTIFLEWEIFSGREVSWKQDEWEYPHELAWYDLETTHQEEYDTYGAEDPDPILITIFLVKLTDYIKTSSIKFNKWNIWDVKDKIIDTYKDEFASICKISYSEVKSLINLWYENTDLENIITLAGNPTEFARFIESIYVWERNYCVIDMVAWVSTSQPVMIPFGYRHFSSKVSPVDCFEDRYVTLDKWARQKRMSYITISAFAR